MFRSEDRSPRNTAYACVNPQCRRKLLINCHVTLRACLLVTFASTVQTFRFESVEGKGCCIVDCPFPLLSSIGRFLSAFHEFLLVLRRQLRLVDGNRQLAEFRCEFERNLIVPIVNRGAGVRAYVERLVPLQD